MKPVHLRLLVSLIATLSCAGTGVARGEEPVSPCGVEGARELSTSAEVEGVRLKLPKDADGPYFDSDDWHRSRPTWSGARWQVHFVYGNGGIIKYMSETNTCSLDDGEMRRRVKIGQYIRYGAVADIWHVGSPNRVTSMQVSIEPRGLRKRDALAIIATAVTTWESP